MPTFIGSNADEFISTSLVSNTVLKDGAAFPGDTDDLIYGGGGLDQIYGGLGADSLFGDAGTDHIVITATTALADGGLDFDTVYSFGMTGGFFINLGTGVTNVAGQSVVNFEAVIAEAGNDTLVGSVSADFLSGEQGDDFLDGMGGADSQYGGIGNDTIVADIHAGFGSGGLGTDLLDASAISTGFSFNLATGVSNLGSALFQNFENLEAGAGNDSLTGTLLGNVITGGRGDDAINGFGGQDSSYGGAGDDYIVAVIGVDVGDGGRGEDFLDASLYNGDYSVNLTTGVTSFVGESFLNFEILVTGNGNDTLIGNAADNQLVGSGGNDLLQGKAGGDRLSGQSGLDTMVGGLGSDVFAFAQTSESPSASPDVIRGDAMSVAFEGAGAAGGDKIDLSAIDADEGVAGDQSFLFHSGLTGGVKLVNLLGNTLVQCNTDADAAFELVILIEDGAVRAGDYVRGDFIL